MQSNPDPNIPPILETNKVPPVLPTSPLFGHPNAEVLSPKLENDFDINQSCYLTEFSKNEPTGRWKKHLLFATVVLSIVVGIGWATSQKASLIRKASIEASSKPIGGETVRAIDQAMLAAISRQDLGLAPNADWLTICRRISLGLTGAILSLEEIRALEQIPESERVNWWTDYLLKDRRSADYLGERWTRATVGTNSGPFLFFRRRKYADWISDEIQSNTPYNQIVKKLLSASGFWTDAPEVNFYTATMNADGDRRKPDVVRMAGRTSRAFLAQRIDCLQCHRDYLGNVQFPASTNDKTAQSDSANSLREGEQHDFHQLASFFAGVAIENPFVGMTNVKDEYRYRYLNETEDVLVDPNVPYAAHLLPPTGTPRERLAAWITHPENRAFARAAVNRMWGILFGRPWIQPIDSIPVNGPFPAGFELLVDDFIKSDFNLHRLIKVIVQTQAFQRDSRLTDGEPTAQHEDFWAVFPLTQLRPEQVAASIHQSCRIKAINENSSIISRLELYRGIDDFTKDYGDRGDDEFSECPVTIPQRLLVMNGDFMHERIKENPVLNAATRIAMLATNERAIVNASYLAILNRMPSEMERTTFEDHIGRLQGEERNRAVEDMYWTLLNSTEFLWNH